MSATRTAMLALLLLPAVAGGCLDLDFFIWEPEGATSVEQDYHGLPLYLADDPPAWLRDAAAEREIYLEIGSGNVIPAASRDTRSEYLHAVFLPAPTGCPPLECPLVGQGVTLLYQHGNAGNLLRYWYRAVTLWSLGANVLIYTYRGYGLSRGEPSRENVLADAETAMAYLKRRPDVDPARIFAYGYSLGAIPTSHLVGLSHHRHDFAGAVIESGLDSPESILKHSTGMDLPGGYFLRTEEAAFDGPAFVHHASLPILQMHGSKDQRVIIDQAWRYYEVLKHRADYTHYVGKSDRPDESWIQHAGHRNIPFTSFPDDRHIPTYWDDPDNPHHCCIHPVDFSDARMGPFIQKVTGTTAAQLVAELARCRGLISGWVLAVLQ